MTDSVAAVEARGITKLFGGIPALDRVDLRLERGEVHALLGENGAGKTTLSNIFAGIYRADEGQILVSGEEQHFRSPAQAIASGIGMVHQHFRLVAPMTVAENIHLGWSETPRVITAAALEARTQGLMDDIGLHVDPAARIWQLSVGEQQRVEILRVLARGANVLILDEPTAVLTQHEARDLFGVMRRLVAGGRTVVFISHKLNEVLEVSDAISVLRNGRHVATMAAAGATVRELARLMTGAEFDLAVDHRMTAGEVVLELKGVEAHNARGLPALHGVDLTVRRGEILGIAGVSGNGQTELAEVITSLRRVERGSVLVNGRDMTNAPSRAVAESGVGHIPEDRIGVGMVKSASVKHNAVMRHYRSPELSRGFQFNLAAVGDFARRLVSSARVQTRSIEAPAGQMSGGNQQRLVARREAMVAENLLVAAHPTRGLDVLAAQEVQQTILDRRDMGCAVMMISDDLDEVLLLSDRVAVMYEGVIAEVIDRVDVDRERIGLLMGGHTAVTADGRSS